LKKKVGRNDPCPCGSGKKYKKCCLLNVALHSPATLSSDVKSIIGLQNNSAEPYLDLVSSVAWKGYRWRAVFNQIHYRPIRETFHEFLINVIKWTFGEQWWKHQIKMKPTERHVVISWNYALSEFQKQHSNDAHRETDGVTYTAEAPGPLCALLSLGYDFFCLQSENQLPEFLVERLRRHREFQGARYEIAAAAIMARSGFEIRFLDELAVQEKHCEFIATHKGTRIRIGVEAKSRVRSGVIHEKGEFNYMDDWKGILNLIRRAKKQKPTGLPFFIFVDVNLPPSPSVLFDQKPWVADLKRAIEELEKPSSRNPQPWTALIPTNFSHHYGSMEGKSCRDVPVLLLSLYPENPIPDLILLNVITETLNRYDRIPDEV
jgi:hypothetical protein